MNVIPFIVCRALGITPTASQWKVTQLDKTKMNVVGELIMIPM